MHPRVRIGPGLTIEVNVDLEGVQCITCLLDLIMPRPFHALMNGL